MKMVYRYEAPDTYIWYAFLIAAAAAAVGSYLL